MKKRKCQFPQCKTVLNYLNKEPFCCLHQRVVNQNGLFYQAEEKTIVKKIKIRRGFYRRNPMDGILTPSPFSTPELLNLKGPPVDLASEKDED